MSDQDVARCPVCGEGMLADLSFDLARDGDIAQTAESRQLETYTCGHRVAGNELQTADAEDLAVERRTSEETTDPPTIDEDRGRD